MESKKRIYPSRDLFDLFKIINGVRQRFEIEISIHNWITEEEILIHPQHPYKVVSLEPEELVTMENNNNKVVNIVLALPKIIMLNTHSTAGDPNKNIISNW